MQNASLRAKFTATGGWIDEELPENRGQRSGIYIETTGKWEPEKTASRPAVLIKESDWKWQTIGMNNTAGSDVRTGTRFFGGMWLGAHTLFATARKPAEAQTLGTEVAKIMMFYSSDIIATMGLSKFAVASIGAVGKLEESPEDYTVPVVVGYVVPENWSLTPEAPRLKRITWRTGVVLDQY